MAELKPCPFCGKDAQIAPDEIGSGGQHVPPYHAGCLRGAGCGIAFTADDPDEAIAEWNRRAALSSVAAAEREPVAWGGFYDGEIGGAWTTEDEAKDAAFWHKCEIRPLYTSPPTSELEALRKRVAELEKALGPFADIADVIDAETEGMSETDELKLHFHDYLMASWPVAMFRTARRAREQGGE